VQLGRVLAAEGKNDEAVAELEEGLKAEPGNVSVERDLADTYVAAGKPQQAEAIYRSLCASNPNDAELHRAFGQMLLKQKKFPQAQQEFLITVKLKPAFGEAYGDLAFAAGENKDYTLAVKALDVRAKFLPEIPITYFLRASALDHLKDYKAAAAQYHLFLKTAEGKYPDQEWQAKHRLVAIEPKK
jgi:tetratricopeptide (TPR) repeat protein